MLSVDGLISGFDTSKIIAEILAYERRPVALLREQADLAAKRKSALMGVSAKLLALQGKAQALSRAAAFTGVAVSSSNSSVLAASGSTGLAPGSATFRVSRLARAAAFSSNGFETADRTAVGEGTVWIELGNARVDRETDLSILNGGRGIDRGSIRITDRSGASAVVDLSGAVTIGDVRDAIDRAAGIQVTARLAGPGDDAPGRAIVLVDGSGGAGTLRVQDVGGRTAARDLGILGETSSSTLQGSAILGLGRSLPLEVLNDGIGVALRAGYDLVIRQKNGNRFSVDLSTARTIGDVLDRVNGHAQNEGISLSIAEDGLRLKVVDATTGTETTRIENGVSGSAATDLGIAIETSASAAEGERIIAGLNTVLVRSLNGRRGIAAGSIDVTDAADRTARIDLSSAETLQDVLDAIAAAPGISVSAGVNRTGNGILLRDASGGDGTLRVSEVDATTAADLGILGAASEGEIDGDPLSIAYVGRGTRLSTFREGRGVRPGRIRITDKAGISFTVDLSQEETVGDVIDDIAGAASAAQSDLQVRINDAGNGIILVSPTGTGTLRVEDLDGGSAAADLRIAGSAAGEAREIDGAGRRAISIDADDTLADVRRAIDALGLEIAVEIVNDGSRGTPCRLSIRSKVPGQAGAAIVDSTGTSLVFERIAIGEDAAILYGDSSPMLLRSPTNTFSGVIGGLTVTALSPSGEPVTVTAAADPEEAVGAARGFVDAYNAVIAAIADLTSWDAETETGGILIGDGTVRSLSRAFARAIVRPVRGLPAGGNLLSNIGIRVSRTGELLLDEAQLRRKLAEDPEAVARIFASARTLESSTPLADFEGGAGVSSTDAGPELRIHQRDGTTIDVEISGARTVRDLLRAINEARENTGDLVASISPDGRSILIEDGSTGSTPLRVVPLNGSSAASELGLNRSADLSGGGRITGREVNLAADEGVARRLVETIDGFIRAGDGMIPIRTDGLGSRIDDLRARIDELEGRISRRAEVLRRQFAQLESLLAQNQNTLSFLQSSLTHIASSPRRR